MKSIFLKMKTNFSFENLNQLFVFDYLFILILDNSVYKEFAYTPCKRIFKVLIYWIDIESHSRHPEMVLMIDRSSSEIYVRVLKMWYLYISYWLVWEPKLDRAYCCDLASKIWFLTMYQSYQFENSNPRIDCWLCCLFNCLIILNHYA